MPSEREELLERIRSDLANGRALALASYLATLHPADIAEVLGLLDRDERQRVLHLVDRAEEAHVLEAADEAVRAEVLEELDDKEVSEIVEELDPDEAADLLSEMPEERAEHVLEMMAPPEAREVGDLLRYPPESAGGRMSPELVRVREDLTVGEVLAEIRANERMREEDVYNIYVVDPAERAVGVVKLWSLLRADPAAPVREVMEQVQTIPADMDQEEVAALFQKYDMAAAPVVDSTGRLLGRITFDDIQDVVVEEANEDISKFAGTDDDELASSSALTTARLRLPWLLVCLAGTFVSGSVISHFGGTIKAHFILMIFVPAVMATAGNSGLQTATMTVRSLATGHADRIGARAIVLKQIRASALVALTCGVVAGLVGAVWSHFSPHHMSTGSAVLLGSIIGGAMFAAICLSSFLGVLVPMTFRKLGVDPAVASGPLITTSSDIFSLVVYLGVATALLVRFAT